MKKLLLLLIIPFLSIGQGWIQTYSNLDSENCNKPLIQTLDGGFLIICDYNVLKINNDGGLEWNQEIDSFITEPTDCTMTNQQFSDVIQAVDEGYLIIGSNYCSGAPIGQGTNNFIIKLSPDGNIEWIEYNNDFDDYGSFLNDDDGYLFNAEFISVGLTDPLINDNGYVGVLGTRIMKINDDFLMEWESESLGDIKDFQPIYDGGYLVVADTVNYKLEYPTSFGINLFKLDANGNTVWTQNTNYGTQPYSSGLDAESIVETYDGGFLIIGNQGAQNTAFKIKINEDGLEEWSDLNVNQPDFYVSIQQTADQGYILQGHNYSEVYLEKVYGNFNTPSAIEELDTNKKLITTIDILGRETTNNKGFQLHIYDDGSVEKKYLIK